MRNRNPESAVRPLIVKVGSESLDFESLAMEGLVSDLAHVMKNTERRVLVVTSGAVEHGRKALGYKKKRSELTEGEKRRCSSVGQHRLMAGWDALFATHGLFSAQMLVTHALVEDSASTALDVISGIRENWNDPRIVSCLNENDPVNSEEIRAMGRGADNDKNAFLIARLVWADSLAIMTTSNGVYAKAGRPETREPILRARHLSDETINRMCDEESEGNGGMASKLTVARDFALGGGTAYVFNGTDSSLSDFLERENPKTLPGGTVIVP